MTEVKEYDWNMLAGIGIIGGLIFIYAAYALNTMMNVTYFSFLGAVGAILAVVWGADAVRRICKYGIGTGVPSIGMLAFGMGLLATLLGLRIGDYAGVVYVGPVAALAISLIQGAIIGYLANVVLKMKIPTMQVGMIFIAGAASIILMGFTVTMAGTFTYGNMISKVFNTGFIAPLFMLGALPMLHPFNACLGPDEDQRRTLTLAVEASLLSTIMFGIFSIALINVVSSAITVVLGLIAWAYAYLAYFKKVKESGVPVVGTGLLPKKEA